VIAIAALADEPRVLVQRKGKVGLPGEARALEDDLRAELGQGRVSAG
jgi:hypothetical protein